MTPASWWGLGVAFTLTAPLSPTPPWQRACVTSSRPAVQSGLYETHLRFNAVELCILKFWIIAASIGIEICVLRDVVGLLVTRVCVSYSSMYFFSDLTVLIRTAIILCPYRGRVDARGKRVTFCFKILSARIHSRGSFLIVSLLFHFHSVTANVSIWFDFFILISHHVNKTDCIFKLFLHQLDNGGTGTQLFRHWNCQHKQNTVTN